MDLEESYGGWKPYRAVLVGAEPCGVDFTGADLIGTDLVSTYLIGIINVEKGGGGKEQWFVLLTNTTKCHANRHQARSLKWEL